MASQRCAQGSISNSQCDVLVGSVTQVMSPKKQKHRNEISISGL